MSMTNFSLLTSEQKTVWAMDMWRQARNMSFINKFLGKGPNSMIQHITELKASEKGARAVITLLADLEGDGVAGDRTLEGNEEGLKSYDQVIRIDQLRNATRHEGRMADQKSVVNFREDARDTLAYWMSDRLDQLAFLTLAGISYAYKPDGSTRVGSDLINLEYGADVTTPTAKRRLRWDATAGALVESAATADVVATDLPSYKMLVSLKAFAKTQYVRGVRMEGGGESYHVFLTPLGMAALKKDADYIANLRYAQTRGEDNQLFTGETVKMDGLYLHEFRHVPNTSGLSSGKFGSGGTVNGQYLLFCGAQSLGMADIGVPEWVEKGFDYENQQGISVGKIAGFKKPVFNSIYAANTVQDFGVITCYTAY
jgi:N4-gp56 family major capsid protein